MDIFEIISFLKEKNSTIRLISKRLRELAKLKTDRDGNIIWGK